MCDVYNTDVHSTIAVDILPNGNEVSKLLYPLLGGFHVPSACWPLTAQRQSESYYLGWHSVKLVELELALTYQLHHVN